MAVKVSYATGRYEDYDNDRAIPGRIYYLVEDNGTPHIFLNKVEYTKSTASDVIFQQDITVTSNVGNYHAGNRIAAGTSLETLITNMLSEDIYPTAVSPSVSFTSQSTSWVKLYEIGSIITPIYDVSLSGGAYKVTGQADQPGGVTASAWNIHITNNNAEIPGSSDQVTSSGSFPEFQFTNTSDKIKITATATGTQGNMPKTFLGNNYPSIRFATGATYSTVAGNASCYRAKFYGWVNGASPLDYSNLTSSQIRSQDIGSKSSSIPSTITTQNMQQMYFAVPAGIYSTITVVNRTTGLPQSVYKYASTVNVEGANSFAATAYDVWYIKNDAPETGSSTFTITCS